MFLLILESLGSTELLFILVMALVFFGPRKLPQISRSLGKNIADFRRASEDFKRTWEKEVSVEETSAAGVTTAVLPAAENSILGGLDGEQVGEPVQQPTIQAIAPDRIVARQPHWPESQQDSDSTNSASAGAELDNVPDETKHSLKSDWL